MRKSTYYAVEARLKLAFGLTSLDLTITNSTEPHQTLLHSGLVTLL